MESLRYEEENSIWLSFFILDFFCDEEKLYSLPKRQSPLTFQALTSRMRERIQREEKQQKGGGGGEKAGPLPHHPLPAASFKANSNRKLYTSCIDSRTRMADQITPQLTNGSTGFRLMTRDITHVHATKNSTELRKSVHVDPIVKFKVSKKTRLVN